MPEPDSETVVEIARALMYENDVENTYPGLWAIAEGYLEKCYAAS